MLFKSLFKYVLFVCFLSISSVSYADSLEGHWKFCYYDGEWIYNASIFIEKEAGVPYFFTRDDKKYIATHGLRSNSAIIVKPGYESVEELRKSPDFEFTDYVSLHGPLNFTDDKVVAVFHEVVYAFSYKDYYLTMMPMGNHLKGYYNGSFLRPLNGPVMELERFYHTGNEQWFKNIGAMGLCQDRAREHLKKRYDVIAAEKKEKILKEARESSEKREVLIRATRLMIASAKKENEKKEELKKLKDPFLNVAEELLDQLLKMDTGFSKEPVFPKEENIAAMKEQLSKAGAILDIGENLGAPEVTKVFGGLISKTDKLLTIAQVFDPNNFEEDKVLDLIDIIPIQASPAMAGAPGYVLKEVLKWDIKGFKLATEGLNIVKDGMDNDGWQSSLQQRAEQLDRKLEEWKKGPFGDNPTGFFKKIIEDIPLVRSIFKLFE
ncbi:MAG: hypothetical protein HYW47_01935 [Deltaproteobacteria bacterium]|nr:hypothetical protein [Deltaproteobacteria bacterium]